MTLKDNFFLLLLISAVLFFSGCTCPCRTNPCLCTEIFVFQTITVVEPGGNPIRDAQVTARFKDSGESTDCSEYRHLQEGQYCILSDRQVKLLDETGKIVSVKIEKRGFNTVVEEYLFNTDNCKCHINLLAGETEVVLSADGADD